MVVQLSYMVVEHWQPKARVDCLSLGPSPFLYGHIAPLNLSLQVSQGVQTIGVRFHLLKMKCHQMNGLIRPVISVITAECSFLMWQLKNVPKEQASFDQFTISFIAINMSTMG